MVEEYAKYWISNNYLINNNDEILIDNKLLDIYNKENYLYEKVLKSDNVICNNDEDEDEILIETSLVNISNSRYEDNNRKKNIISNPQSPNSIKNNIIYKTKYK